MREHVGFLLEIVFSYVSVPVPSHIIGYKEHLSYVNHIFYEPVSHSTTSPRLFLHTDRVTEELRVYLNTSCDWSLCVQLKSYDTVRDHLKQYVAQPGVKVWIGTEYTNYALYEIITPEVRTHFI